MRLTEQLLTRFTSVYLKNLVFVLLIFSLETSVFAVTCLEHLVGKAHQDHHTLFSWDSDEHTADSPDDHHHSPVPTTKGLECHLTDGQGLQGEALVPPLLEKMTVEPRIPIPDLQPVFALQLDQFLLLQKGYIDPPKRPPRAS